MSFARSTFVYFGSERFAFLFMTRAKHHVGTGSGKGADTAFADPVAAAGDDDHFVSVGHLIGTFGVGKSKAARTSVTHRLVALVLNTSARQLAIYP